MKSFRTIGVVYRGSANEHALGEMPAAEFPFWKIFLLHNFLLLESCMYNFFLDNYWMIFFSITITSR